MSFQSFQLFFAAQNIERLAVALLLLGQACLLGYSATRHSPTDLEPAFLASGLSHWRLGRFEPYRVNPPLVRMVAAIPVLAVGYKLEDTSINVAPGNRAELSMGHSFLHANGADSIPLFFYARWACIPFNLLGAYFAYRWAKELYSGGAGIFALLLYVFEPNLLAHGELITPDGATTAFGIVAGYAFWRWLKDPSWGRTFLAGGALGLAELSKMSWLILFGLWPALWVIWRWMESWNRPKASSTLQSAYEILASSSREFAERKAAGNVEQSPSARDEELIAGPVETDSVGVHADTHGTGSSQPAFSRVLPPFSQLAVILLLGLYCINLGYAFDGFGTPLGNFQFVSKSFTGLDKSGATGNRFRDTWFTGLPVPLPRQYILGFDSQKKDLEGHRLPSYLRGEWKKHGGWWYYYLYGLLVKVPCGTWGLLALVMASRISRRIHRFPARLQDELVLLTPALALMFVVSSQTAFNHHLRYVFPALGIGLIFLGQAGVDFARRFSILGVTATLLLGESLLSLALVFPHHLAYFNAFAGGPQQGHRHLLGSSLDWGQDLLFLRDHVATTGKIVVEVQGSYISRDLFRTVIPNYASKTAVGPHIIVVSPNCMLTGGQFSPDGKMLTPTLWIVDRTRNEQKRTEPN